jgi:hypothetical protein
MDTKFAQRTKRNAPILPVGRQVIIGVDLVVLRRLCACPAEAPMHRGVGG